MITKCFITGSRAYGTPKLTGTSDYDVVIRCEKADSKVFGVSDPVVFETPNGEAEYPLDDNGTTCKFGDLNFILCFTDARFQSWKTGTEKLKIIAPVTREVAVAMFKGLFALEPKKEKTKC